MFTTAGSADFKTLEKPLLKFPRGTGLAFRARVTLTSGAPRTVWPDQSFNPMANTPPPISVASSATTATQRAM